MCLYLYVIEWLRWHDRHLGSHLAGWQVKRTRQLAGFATKIEVECRSLPEAFEATEAGADVVMLDNFGPGELGRAALELKAKYPYVIVEAAAPLISGRHPPTRTRYF